MITSFLKNSQIPINSQSTRLKRVKGKLTIDECFKSLNSFENNKSPGNDGLTAEFYKAFWNIVGDLMVSSLNYAYDHGELSNTQKQAIITLLEKKDEDKRDISNW